MKRDKKRDNRPFLYKAIVILTIIIILMYVLFIVQSHTDLYSEERQIENLIEAQNQQMRMNSQWWINACDKYGEEICQDKSLKPEEGEY